MFIKINDNNVFFDVYGSKLLLNKNSVVQKPTLIVLHGGHGFADHTLYVEFWSQFQDIIQVIFIDQHGCGRSDAGTPDSWNLSRWANDIKIFCDALGIEKPILAGVSMGGHVIGEYARYYSDSLGGIILCNTEAKFNAEGITEQFIKHGYPDAARSCIQFYQEPSEQTFKDYAEYCLPLYAKNAYSDAEKKRCISNIDVFLHYVKNQMSNFDYREDFSKISCPALIMVGERGSHTAEAAYEMASYMPKELLSS
jgi:pimeloyl-ACP methyl ester carboxylesterase